MFEAGERLSSALTDTMSRMSQIFGSSERTSERAETDDTSAVPRTETTTFNQPLNTWESAVSPPTKETTETKEVPPAQAQDVAGSIVTTPPDEPRGCLGSIFGLQVTTREYGPWYMLVNKDMGSNCMNRCLCKPGNPMRVDNGLASVPQLYGLAGLLMEAPLDPDKPPVSSAGSLVVLRWAEFREEQRELKVQVAGGFGGPKANTGAFNWSDTLSWKCCAILASLNNQTYNMYFSPDWKHADIKVQLNPCGVCLPCCPAWMTVDDQCVKFDMVAAEGVEDGTHFVRRSSLCNSPLEYSYDLVTVVNPDGTNGPFADAYTKFAPENMVVAR